MRAVPFLTFMASNDAYFGDDEKPDHFNRLSDDVLLAVCEFLLLKKYFSEVFTLFIEVYKRQDPSLTKRLNQLLKIALPKKPGDHLSSVH